MMRASACLICIMTVAGTPAAIADTPSAARDVRTAPPGPRMAAKAPATAAAKKKTPAAAPSGTDPEADHKDCYNLSGDAAIAACTRAIASKKFTGPTLVTLYVDRAFEWLGKADYDHALADCNEAIRVDAKSGTAHIYKARALLGKQDANTALAEAAEGLRLSPDDVVGLVARGEAERRLGHADTARADFNKALALKPSGGWALQTAQAGLAAMTPAPTAATDPEADHKDCFNLSGDAAIAACGRAIASGKFTGSTLVIMYVDRAFEWIGKADYDRALADCNEAIRVDPRNGTAHITKARALLGKQDANGALIEAAEGLRLAPDDTVGLVTRAEAERKLGQIDAARADYDKALGLNPGSWAMQAAQAGLAALAAAAPATDPNADSDQCYNNKTEDARRAACDRAIASGKFAGKELARLFESRAVMSDLHDDLAHAIADFSEVIQLDPQNVDALRFRGVAYLKTQDYARAIADLSAALKLDPQHEATLGNRAQAYYDNKSYDLAATDFSAVIRLDPSAAYAYLGRADALGKLGRRDEAVADYNKVLSLSPDSEWGRAAKAGLGADYAAWLDQAASCKSLSGEAKVAACNAAIASGKISGHDLAQLFDFRAYAYTLIPDLDRAIADYSDESKLEPDNGVPLANRCWAYFTKKDYAHALPDCNDAVRLAPSYAYAYAARGHVLSEVARRDEATADYYKSLSLNPDDATRQWAQAGLDALGVNPAVADGDAKQCHDLSGGPAIAACDRAIASGKFFGSPLAAIYTDRCYEWMNKADYDRALADCGEAFRADANVGYAHVYKARSLLLGKSDPKSAIVEVNLGIKQLGKVVIALAVRGDAERALGRRDEAQQDYAAALALKPTGWPLQSAQAGLAALASTNADTGATAGADPSIDPDGDQMSCKDFSGKAAVAACGRAIASGKFSGQSLADLHRQRATADDETQNFSQAIVDYSGVIAYNPDSSDVFRKRGDAYRGMRDFDHAIADYTEAIERRPSDWIAYQGRGQAYFSKDDYDHAIADYGDALNRVLSPDNLNGVNIFVLRGLAYAAKGDRDHAIADYGEAIKLDPTSALAFAARGVTLGAAGRRDEAIADFNKVLSLNADADLKQQAQAGLAALNPDFQQCQAAAGDPAIPACDRAIASGTFGGTVLAALYNSRGGLLYDKNQFDPAMADFDQAIRLDPALATAYLNRGYGDLSKQDRARAIADFSDFIRLAPDRAIGYGLRATVLLDQKDYDHAITDLDHAIKLDPKQFSPFYNRGQAYSGKHDYEHAIADYTQAIALNPAFVQAVVERGNANAQLGRRDQAIADYNQVLSVSQDNALKQQAQAGLAALGAAGAGAAGAGAAAGAGDDAAKCATLTGAPAIAACGRAIATGALTGSALADAYTSRGGQYTDANQFDLAIADLDAAIKIDPNLADAYWNRAYAELGKNDQKAAVADFSTVIRLNPSNAVAYFNRGNVYANTGDRVHAIADFSEAMRLNPKNASAPYYRGLAYYGMKDYDKAIADYGAALALDPKLAGVLYDRGNAYAAKHDYAHAIADYTAQIAADPNDVRALRRRGQAHEHANQIDEAIADYSAVIKINPNSADDLAYRGEIYYGQHDLAHAIADYNEAIRLDPKSATNWADRGEAYFDQGDFDRAVADFEAAVKLDSSNGALHVATARALLAAGKDKAMALAEADAGVLLSPDDDEAYAVRGDANRANGLIVQARADYTKAQSINRNNKIAAAGLKLLAGAGVAP